MSYADDMADRLTAGIGLPDEFREMFDWMEAGDRFMASGAYPGDSLGLLGTENDVHAGRVTAILFRVATPEQAREHTEAWFSEGVEGRVVPFARTGRDGSHAAFWLDDDGVQRIVHLGSEGLVCLLGRTPLDFLRLVAIGYEEISGECLDGPGEPPGEPGRNAGFRAWLSERFGVTIPERAAEILGEIPDPLAEASDDPFWRWVRRKQNDRDRGRPPPGGADGKEDAR